MKTIVKKPEDILNEWLLAVNKGDIKYLLTLYNKKAVLIPTFSNRLLRTPKDLRDYFVRLGNRKGLSVELHKNTLIMQKIKEDVYTLSGIYRWRFSVDSESLTFEARFSYVLNLALASPIIQHHSSQIPRML